MHNVRFEEYTAMPQNRTFIIFDNIFRSHAVQSSASNWHQNLELQFFTSGKGFVLIDGEKYAIAQYDIAIIPPNAIHYTGTQSTLTYSALIVDNLFFSHMGVDFEAHQFETIIKDETMFRLFLELKTPSESQFRAVKENAALTALIGELLENFVIQNTDNRQNSFETVKKAILYIRENYKDKITLENISKHIGVNKFMLSREFKKATGQTVVEYINLYRCKTAYKLLINGVTVTAAAIDAGFNNFSYFSRTFKKCIGILPSKIKTIK